MCESCRFKEYNRIGKDGRRLAFRGRASGGMVGMKQKRALVCILLACVLFCSAGCFNVQFREPSRPVGMTDPSSAFDPSAFAGGPGYPAATDLYASTAAAVGLTTNPAAPASVTEAPVAPSQGAAATTAPAAGTKTPDSMTSSELLTYFNDTLNKVKTQNVGFTKTKKTDVLDLQLSNSAANTVVGMVKSALLSSNSDVQTVPKGNPGTNVFSPTGKNYISTLTDADVTSVTCTKNGADYVIKVAVKGETNPGEGSAMSRAFDYITVDDVMTTYAPKVNATVDRSNVQVVFSDCTAELTVDAAGHVRSYTTYVKGVMNLLDASVQAVLTINTDVAVTLASTTDYTNFIY